MVNDIGKIRVEYDVKLNDILCDGCPQLIGASKKFHCFVFNGGLEKNEQGQAVKCMECLSAIKDKDPKVRITDHGYNEALKNINRRLGGLEAKLGETGSQVGFRKLRELEYRIENMEKKHPLGVHPAQMEAYIEALKPISANGLIP